MGQWAHKRESGDVCFRSPSSNRHQPTVPFASIPKNRQRAATAVFWKIFRQWDKKKQRDYWSVIKSLFTKFIWFDTKITQRGLKPFENNSIQGKSYKKLIFCVSYKIFSRVPSFIGWYWRLELNNFKYTFANVTFFIHPIYKKWFVFVSGITENTNFLDKSYSLRNTKIFHY